MSALLRPGDQLTTAGGRTVQVRAWRGEGYYARVYLGQLDGAGDCAVKLARREIAEAAAKLGREREALVRAPVSGIPHLLDHGTRDEVPFLALEWVPGDALPAAVRARRRLPLATALDAAAQAAETLAALHARGVAHGDARAENMRMCGGRLVLMDLGEAVFAGEPAYETTRAGDLTCLAEALLLMVTGERGPTGAARLSPDYGINPAVVHLWEQARSGTAQAEQVAADARVLLARLGHR